MQPQNYLLLPCIKPLAAVLGLFYTEVLLNIPCRLMVLLEALPDAVWDSVPAAEAEPPHPGAKSTVRPFAWMQSASDTGLRAG